MKTASRAPAELVRCPVCETYVDPAEGFTCPKCRKGPQCRKHRAPGRRECTSCVFEAKRQEAASLRQQEKSIKDFMRFMQFIFLVFAALFIGIRAGFAEFVDFLKDSILVNSLAYLGIIPVVGYLLFLGILYNQRNRIKEIEADMHSLEFKRMVK